MTTIQKLYQDITNLGLDAFLEEDTITVNKAELTYVITKEETGYSVLIKNYNTNEEFCEFYSRKDDFLDMIAHS
ncbi:hypothetical protein [Filifactor alocis]|uniref:hypothetical protein n=1 Tax=Filifactor alocis TaxID=143361 RepID=UPI003FA180F8